MMNCVSLLLLLCVLLFAALGPFHFVAAARREPTMAATGDQGDAAQAKLATMEMAPAEGAQDQRVIMRKEESTHTNHFRTRKLPSDANYLFDGQLPFTADYHRVRRHPPSHN